MFENHIMHKLFVLFFCLISFCSQAQNDVLVLQKRGMHERAYTIGDPMVFKTIYGQWFNGTIEDLHHDTIYISGQAFHYNEIAVIQRMATKLNWAQVGTLMMIVGGGFVAISAINGALRQDQPKEWFTARRICYRGCFIGRRISC